MISCLINAKPFVSTSSMINMFTRQSDPLVASFIFHLANHTSKQEDKSDQHIIAMTMQDPSNFPSINNKTMDERTQVLILKCTKTYTRVLMRNTHLDHFEFQIILYLDYRKDKRHIIISIIYSMAMLHIFVFIHRLWKRIKIDCRTKIDGKVGFMDQAMP